MAGLHAMKGQRKLTVRERAEYFAARRWVIDANERTRIAAAWLAGRRNALRNEITEEAERLRKSVEATGNALEIERTANRLLRAEFDDVIDCLYEFDLGEPLPERWPREVRQKIEAARKRLMRKGL